MPYKMAVFDLDGTLVADLHKISPRVLGAVKAAQDAGVIVTIATGREFAVTQQTVRDLNLNVPFICTQGALVHDPRTDQTLVSNGFNIATTQRVVEVCREKNLSLYFFYKEKGVTESPNDIGREFFTMIRSPIDEVPDILATIPPVPIKGLVVHDPATVDAVKADLDATFPNGDLNITRSLDTLIELTAPGVSKGAALAQLAAQFDIAQSEVIAVGDSHNDVDMVAWAGLGVAMGNAVDEVKAVADVVAPSITEDGAAWVIEEYLLKNR